MRLSDLAKSGHFIRIVEVFPPAIPSPDDAARLQKFDLDLRFDRLIQSISRVEAIADAFSLPELKDGNRIHLNSVGIATELTRKTGSVVIPTITLRDSNRHSLLGTIAYALFASIENVLLVRGDPYFDGKSKGPKNVYDFEKVSDLISTTRRLESTIAKDHPLCILSPINLAKAEDSDYLKITRDRELSGVDIFLAEQMFEEIDSYLRRIELVRKFGIRKPIIHSIFPLKDYEDAKALIEKFGWQITDFELANLKRDGAEYGLELARKRYRQLLQHKDLVQGVSISTRGNPEVARHIFR